MPQLFASYQVIGFFKFDGEVGWRLIGMIYKEKETHEELDPLLPVTKVEIEIGIERFVIDLAIALIPQIP